MDSVVKCPKCGAKVRKREINHHDCWGAYDGCTIVCICQNEECGFIFKYNED